MNRIKLNAVLAGIAIAGASIITGIAQAEEVTTNTLTTSEENSATLGTKPKAQFKVGRKQNRYQKPIQKQETPAHSQQPQAPQRAFNVLIERSIVPIHGEFRGLLAVHRSLNVCT